MTHRLATLLIALAITPLTTGVTHAHGCHTNTQQDRYGWHRHDAYSCHRIRSHRVVGFGDYGDGGPRCAQKCEYVGPFKQCKTICR